MKRFFLVLITFVFLFFPQLVLSQNKLDSTTIRLDRMIPGQSPLDILVLITTSSSVTENGLQVTAGQAWTISTNKSDFTVKTTGLPAGVLPLPGIGTATSVSGQTMNFPASDLSPNQSYGFFITGGINSNPAVGTGQNYFWQLATLSGGSVDCFSTVNVPIITSDQIVVTGTVPAHASDFQLNLTADQLADLNVGDEITFQINYGSYLKGAVKPLKISANWSRGTVSGSLVPSVDILDFVVGSGSTAINGVSPIVDLINRQVTWTIPSYPANTINSTVSFKLRLNDSYTGSSRVNFTVDSYLKANSVTVSSSLSGNLKNGTASSSTSTSISTSTSSTSSTTPTPTITSTPLKIKTINISSLSTSSVKIFTAINQTPQQIKIKYGRAANKLTQSVISLNALQNDYLKIDNLIPGTDYFFQLEVSSTAGQTVSSDIYTFRTPTISQTPQINQESLIISVSNIILLDAQNDPDESNSIVITPKQNYSLRVNLNNSQLIKSIKVLITNSQVLGINTIYGAEPNSATVDLLEITPGGYIGHLISPPTPGFYDINIHIEDTNGNITEEKIGTLRVINPLTVIDQQNQPIENAKIIFYRYNSKTQIYDLLTSSSGIKNPSYTESNGKLNTVLPKGKYKIEVSQIGFATQEINFTIGLAEDEKMPQVILIKSPVTFLNSLKYYQSTITDFFSFSGQYFINLSTSSRIFKLMSLLVFTTGLIMIWVFITRFYKIPWWSLPLKIANKFKKNNRQKLRGTIIDQNNNYPVYHASVYLIDGKKNKVLSENHTNQLGNFSLQIEPSNSYRLAVIKDGYDPTPMLDYTPEGINANNLIIKINQNLSIPVKIQKNISQIFQKTLQIFVSAWLLLSLILEIIFSQNFALTKTWPSVAISCFNILIWLIIVFKLNDKK